MNPTTQSRPDRHEAFEVFSTFAVGLGMVTMVLFPFVIPGLAILVLFAVPLLPLFVPVVVLVLMAMTVRGIGRLIARSRGSLTRRADGRTARARARRGSHALRHVPSGR